MGSDHDYLKHKHKHQLFQSTLPHGERQFNDSYGVRRIEFQSTLPHGERRQTLSIPLIIVSFQSTLPHGERRPLSTAFVFSPTYFNPRSRMGNDLAHSVAHDNHLHFNPRSRMGSDECTQPDGHDVTYFNPRSRMGSDRAALYVRSLNQISIHAPAWGATPLVYSFCI